MWVKVFEIKEFIDICLAMPIDKNKLTIYEEGFCKFSTFQITKIISRKYFYRRSE